MIGGYSPEEASLRRRKKLQKPTFPKFIGWAHHFKERVVLGDHDLPSRIDGSQAIPHPPCYSTFNEGGGGGIGRAPLRRPRSRRLNQRLTCDSEYPLRHSAFNERGGPE
jgi:hypothetical protein